MGSSDWVSFPKVLTLANGGKILLRVLNQGDGEGFGALVQEASDEELLFLKENFRDPKVIDSWFDRLHYRKVLPLLAIDLTVHRFAAVAILHRGEHAFRHIGDIRLFVSESYRLLGLGRVLLEELIALAWKEDFYWRSAEVIGDHRKVITAFHSKGFEIKARLPDYCRRPNGVTLDVALMLRPMVNTEAEY